jgi:ribose-phosphate pyrophosphokinase
LVATHGVLAGSAVERLNNADVEKILFADTIPLHDRGLERLEVVSMAQLLARAIDRIHRSESVSMLFESESDS